MTTLISAVIAGIAGGMGIGGGTVLIPALTLLSGLSQHQAQSTNLIFFIPTAIAALIVYRKEGTVEWKKAGILMGTGLIGAVIGSFIANVTAGGILRKLFAVFLLIFGVIEVCKTKEN